MGIIRSSKDSKKAVRDAAAREEVMRQHIAARLIAKSTAAGTAEFDESIEGWNPADEARQAKRAESWSSSRAQVESWRSSQAQQSEAGASETTGSDSLESRRYQTAR